MNVGDYIQKKSGKPFKSGRKVQQIKGLTTLPYGPRKEREAATFYADDSIVALDMCRPAGEATMRLLEKLGKTEQDEAKLNEAVDDQTPFGHNSGTITSDGHMVDNVSS
jgi:hypothetical protein